MIASTVAHRVRIEIGAHTLAGAKERGAAKAEIDDVLATGFAVPARYGKMGESSVELTMVRDEAIAMTRAQAIVQELLSLPENAQTEVLDFIEFIKTRKVGESKRRDDADWAMLSLASAMRGIEDEQSPYTLDSLKESFR